MSGPQRRSASWLQLVRVSLRHLSGDTVPRDRVTTDVWVVHTAARLLFLTPEVLPEDRRRVLEVLLPPVPLIHDGDGLPRDGAPVWTKPRYGGRGQGHRLIANVAEVDPVAEAKSDRLVQKVIENHPDVRRFSPDALATQRVVTAAACGEEPRVLWSVLRTGASGSIVDNLAAGGCCFNLDLDSGRLTGIGVDLSRTRYRIHPITGEPFEGFLVPGADEALALCRTAHRELAPEAFTVGWDVAVTPDGPVFVEGNAFCFLTADETVDWHAWYRALVRHVGTIARTSNGRRLLRRWRWRAIASLAFWILAIAAATAAVFMATGA